MSKKDKFILTELGKERLCLGCDEYYPCTAEFFFPNGYTISGERKYMGRCKACYKERYKPYLVRTYDLKDRYSSL